MTGPTLHRSKPDRAKGTLVSRSSAEAVDGLRSATHASRCCSRPWRVMPAFALTIFTGAFLLFQVQPLIGKYILPWFGGGPGVWTTCMLFFQGLLVGGYAYAHLSSRWLKPRMQAALHVLLLLASLCLLPITPSPTWKPLGGENPTLQILGLLAANIGLPYFLLSATGPLMQHWFSHTRPGASPYRLFALSNAGSLLALISFPLFFETHFTRQMQASIWAGGLILFVVANSYCAFRLWKTNNSGVNPQSKPELKPTQPAAPQPLLEPRAFGRKNQLFFWLLLPACASVLLLATTNKLCQDVAVIPFLWVLPLALY